MVVNVCPASSSVLTVMPGSRLRTAAVITNDTNTAAEPKLVAENVLRSIEGPYRMRRPIGRAALLRWFRRLLPARVFEPSLRKAFALEPAGERGAVTSRTPH